MRVSSIMVLVGYWVESDMIFCLCNCWGAEILFSSSWMMMNGRGAGGYFVLRGDDQSGDGATGSLDGNGWMHAVAVIEVDLLWQVSKKCRCS